MCPIGIEDAEGASLIGTIADASGMRVTNVGPTAKAGERLDVAARPIRAEITMLTALDTTVFIVADHIAVVFVQEGVIVHPSDDMQRLAEAIDAFLVTAHRFIHARVQLEPELRVDRVITTVLLLKPAGDVPVVVRSDDYVLAPITLRKV